MAEAPTVDALVAEWRAAAPRGLRAPAPADAIRHFVAWHHRRLGRHPPPDFLRFLALADGGQHDASLLYSVADIMDLTEDAAPLTLIGKSGNVDAYVLRPDGSCAMVNFYGHQDVFEDFADFPRFLARVLRQP